MTGRTCIKCQIELTDDNWNSSSKKHYKYVCKSCSNELSRIERLNLKLEVLKEYGNECVCCQEDKIEFLTIDHVDGTGAEHRKSLGLDYGRDRGTGGHNFYRWLKKNNYPRDNFQILCFNCNAAKHMYGKCPHKH